MAVPVARSAPARGRKRILFLVCLLFAIFPLACSRSSARQDAAGGAVLPMPSPVVRRLVDAAVAQTTYTHSYDPSYTAIPYPGGDVPRETGVCSDVVVRAFRAVGVDLQKLVHEDMSAHFSAYPHLWKLRRPDPNIDHRRVANLMTFFARRRKAVPASQRPDDFLPGDVVAWRLPGGHLHIGLVTDRRETWSGNPDVVHNIGAGARCEDMLFAWPLIGHYRYFPAHAPQGARRID